MHMPTRYNVLYILVDELRRQSVGHLGGPPVTPRIDRLAADGATFAGVSCAYPMCSPSRAALLTGRWPHALTDTAGEPYLLNTRRLDPKWRTYGNVLTDAGYACGWIGKWHNDAGPARTFIPPGPRRGGFDGYWAGVEPSSPRLAPFYFDEDGRKITPGATWEPEMQIDLAERFLEGHAAGDRPFCLTVSMLPPHAPLALPASHQHLLAEAEAALEAVGGRDALHPNVPGRLLEEAWHESIAYHANTLGIDRCVGRLLDALDRLGLADGTLVVFTSDHGDHLLSHGLTGKNQAYEEALAVPLVLRLPDVIPPGVRIDELTSQIDLVPTMYDLCGVGVPDEVQGRSLVPLLARAAGGGPARGLLQRGAPSLVRLPLRPGCRRQHAGGDDEAVEARRPLRRQHRRGC